MALAKNKLTIPEIYKILPKEDLVDILKDYHDPVFEKFIKDGATIALKHKCDDYKSKMIQVDLNTAEGRRVFQYWKKRHDRINYYYKRMLMDD